MKKHILYSLLLLVFLSKASAQSDLQWYILNGKGKVGYSNLGTNEYGTDNIENKFIISNVGLTGSAGSRNDVLIIFDANNHFNSRLLSDTWYEERLTDSMQYYKFLAAPMYLYYTNLYEGEDDPPAYVAVSNTSELNPPYQTISFTEQLTPVYANHDVVLGKDITIIVKNPEYREVKGEDSPTSNVYRLYFEAPIFEPSNVFDGQNFIFPSNCGSFTESEDFVTLNFNSNTKYIYLNFNTYSLGGKALENSVFFHLKTVNGNNIYTHSEKIRKSHDPNYVEVINIFEREPREYWAHMHVQCYNDSREAHVNDAQIALNLPNTVDPTTLEMTDWSYGLTNGGLTQVSMVNNSGRVYFNFSNVPDILNMQGPDYYYVDPSQVAWVEFIVKINSTDPREVANINLKPTRPMTFFDGTPYDITKFIDRCFGNLSSGTDLCERKIMGTYYMSQFAETLAIKDIKNPANTNQQNQTCCAEHCKYEKTHNQCHDRKCCKKKKRFWKNVIPWVIAGVMTVIAVAD